MCGEDPANRMGGLQPGEPICKISLVLEDGQDHGTLRPEQIVWRGEAHIRTLRERAHRQIGIPGLTDQVPGRTENARPAFRLSALTSTRVF